MISWPSCAAFEDFLSLRIPHLPRSTLFPYTTLFRSERFASELGHAAARQRACRCRNSRITADRKSTRLNSSHTVISYAVFCLKKKKSLATTQIKIIANREDYKLFTGQDHPLPNFDED